MDIVEELRKDRENGAKRLVSEYKAGLMSLARRFYKNESDAEELVNATFAKVVANIDDYLEQSAFFAWMCQILTNEFRDSVKRKSNKVEVYPGTLPDIADEGAQEKIFCNLDHSLLRDAIETLPREMKEAIMLHYIAEQPVPVVARFLRLPISTVKWRLHVARKELARRLGAGVKDAVRKPSVKAILLALALCGLTALGAGAWSLVVSGESRVASRMSSSASAEASQQATSDPRQAEASNLSTFQPFNFSTDNSQGENMNISKTHTRAAILAAATVATSATGAIVPDSDTVLYVSCDTDYKFGENLATAEGKLTNVHRKNDRLQTSGAAGAFVHDGSTGNGSANGGYFYSEGGPAATWSPNDYHKSDFTFEVFVRLDSDASLQYVANHNNAWRLQYNSANRLFLRDGSGTYIAGDNTDATLLRDGAWHHVAVVQNRTAGTMSFYVDYKLVGSKAYMVTDPAADSNYLVIGAYSRNGEYNYNNQTTKCAYDELRITKRALTPREFLFQRVCPVDGDTIAYMSFDAGTNPTNAAYDITLDSSALDVGRKSWGTPSYAVQNSVAAQTLHSGAFDSEGFTNSGALAVSISGGSNAGSGHGYHFTDTGRLTGTASFTAELFAQFTDNPSPYYGYVFFQTGIWNCFLETSGKIGCSVAGETRRSSINLVDGKWHHLAAVYDSCAAAFSFYIDHALLERFANVSFDGISHPGALLFGGNNDSNGGMIGGVNGALYDELRITKRALKPTEFITTESIAGRDPIFFARYDSDFEGMAAGRYAVTGEVSAAGAELAASAKASREILNSSKEVLFANAKGLDLLGGTVAYPGNGVFDLNAATAEFFVRKLGGGAADNVVAFGASGAANPVWSLSASGAFVFRTASDNLAASLAIGDGQFHHVAVAYAPSGANTAVTVYLDHTAVASGTLTGGIDFGSGAGFTVGSAGFTGAIDELRLRESARGVAEMLHASPPPATFMVFR